MKYSVIGMDIAKQVFQLHRVEVETGEVERIKLRRDDVLPYFARQAPAMVALEACGSAHWWARKLSALGHQVRLLHPKSVRPFVLRNKTDAAGARAIWTAAQQPDARFVAAKTETQQAILALHRLRAQLLKFRIMQTNALRDCCMNSEKYCPRAMRPCRRHCLPPWPIWIRICPLCCSIACANSGRG